jgi:hypothetical protein
MGAGSPQGRAIGKHKHRAGERAFGGPITSPTDHKGVPYSYCQYTASPLHPPLVREAPTPDARVIPPTGREIVPFPWYPAFHSAPPPSGLVAPTWRKAYAYTSTASHRHPATERTGLVLLPLAPRGGHSPRARSRHPTPRPREDLSVQRGRCGLPD